MTLTDPTLTLQRQNVSTTHETLEAFLKSTGEGSRGGKIIGHTHSGKPIYSSSSPMNLRGGKHIHSKVLANHAQLGYSVRDHLEAAKVHQANYGKTGAMRHHDAAIYHSAAASDKLRGKGATFEPKKESTSTNIGWTSSKKPIFGPAHSANKAKSGVLAGHMEHGYGASEHADAAKAHEEAAAKTGPREGKLKAAHEKLADKHAHAAKVYENPNARGNPFKGT